VVQPQLPPDLEFLAEQEFLEQRDRLAAEAEARLAEEQDRMEQDIRDRANDLLGTEIEAGDGREDIEDALQDRCRRRRRTFCRASWAVPGIMPMRRQANDFA
jgi:hypothetical protein